MSEKTIYIITDRFPFVGGEQFLYEEFKQLESKFERVIYIPLKRSENMISVGNNVRIETALADLNLSAVSSSILLKYFRTTFSIILLEFIRNNGKRSQLKELKKNLVYLKEIYTRFEAFNKIISRSRQAEKSYFYSTWMNAGSLMLAISTKKKTIQNFSFRVNGYDIFDDRQESGYQPFRITNFKYCKNIIALSKMGQDYLISKGYATGKIKQNYSGIHPIDSIVKFGSNEVLNIVSCGFLVKLKRVDRIASSLIKSNKRINWVHFGGGPEMDTIKEIVKKIPSNVSVSLRGNVEHDEILRYFENNRIDAFVHLSETEGLGMVVIEAQSFGIPAIVCAVGGIPEIVNTDTGILLDVDFENQDVLNALEEIQDQKWNSKEKREEIRSNILSKFDVRTNVEQLLNLL